MPLLVAFAVSVAFAFFLGARSGDLAWHRKRPALLPVVSIAGTLQSAGGQQLVMVVFGSSTCGASRGTGLAQAMRDVRDSLQAISRKRLLPFVSIGVALDTDPATGANWLDEIGVNTGIELRTFTGDNCTLGGARAG